MLENAVSGSCRLAIAITIPNPGFPTNVAIDSRNIIIITKKNNDKEKFAQKATFALSYFPYCL